MNIALLILLGIVFYIGYNLLNRIMETPIKYKKKSLSEDEALIYLKILFIRGYVRYGKYNGRMFIESMDRKSRKIIIRKYDFRNKWGMCIYIPEYEEGIFEKMKGFLSREKIERKVWSEWRRSVDMEVVGVDLEDEIEEGVKIIRYAVEEIMGEEMKRGRLKIYFKYIAQAEEHYDFFIEQFEDNPEKIKSIDRPTNWMGRFFSGQRKQFKQ